MLLSLRASRFLLTAVKHASGRMVPLSHSPVLTVLHARRLCHPLALDVGHTSERTSVNENFGSGDERRAIAAQVHHEIGYFLRPS